MKYLDIKLILGLGIIMIGAFNNINAQTFLSEVERRSVIAQIKNELKDSLNNTYNKPNSKTLDNFKISGYLETYYSYD